MALKISYLLFVILLTSQSVFADSTRALCGFSPDNTARPELTSSCIFSQRQGYISVTLDSGERFDFAPVGDKPGNFRDGDGNPVFHQRGLGEEGQLFQLPGRYLFVFWSPDVWNCPQGALAGEGQCMLRHGNLSFAISTSGSGSITQLKVTPAGLAIVNDAVEAELDGSAQGAELADLDADGWPEIYIYVSSAGSGSYGSLAAYAVNNGKSMSPIFLPPLEQTPEALPGYMGHDEFAVVENRLVRRFPIYAEGDTNAAPTGGMRQVQYRLEKGEAGWVLQADRVVNY